MYPHYTSHFSPQYPPKKYLKSCSSEISDSNSWTSYSTDLDCCRVARLCIIAVISSSHVKSGIFFLKKWNHSTTEPTMLTNASCTFDETFVCCALKNFSTQAIHPVGSLASKLGNSNFLAQDQYSPAMYLESPSCWVSMLLFYCSVARVGCSSVSSISRLMPCFFIHLSSSCQNPSIPSMLLGISTILEYREHSS